jgi:hypothetical protein
MIVKKKRTKIDKVVIDAIACIAVIARIARIAIDAVDAVDAVNVIKFENNYNDIGVLIVKYLEDKNFVVINTSNDKQKIDDKDFFFGDTKAVRTDVFLALSIIPRYGRSNHRFRTRQRLPHRAPPLGIL